MVVKDVEGASGERGAAQIELRMATIRGLKTEPVVIIRAIDRSRHCVADRQRVRRLFATE